MYKPGGTIAEALARIQDKGYVCQLYNASSYGNQSRSRKSLTV